MPKEVDPKNFNLLVLARTGYGEDWFPCYEPKKAGITGKLEDHTADAIKFIRDHRNGEQGFEYRIKDTVSGAIID